VNIGIKLHFYTGVAILLPIVYSLDQLISYWSSYAWTRDFLDDKWGFALEEGRDFTAPVWMGEFGYANQGIYWMNFLRYLTDRDVDFAYWALNGKKYGEGYIEARTGDFVYWSACLPPVWAMNGTDCHFEIGGGAGTWAGADTCVFNVPTKGLTCEKYCWEQHRTCVKGQQTDGGGVCSIDENIEPLPANGCLQELESQICVCSKHLWRWDNETFGLLDRDYMSVKTAWRVRDLQALAESPAARRPNDMGCLNDVHGIVCDNPDSA
jgi:hypothetical protein